MNALAGIALALQAAGATPTAAASSGDTAGYWQQSVDYRIAARLDESREVLVASADLRYVNNSPDTLRTFWVHQYLNAFRPGSQWSAVDEREGRQRFQALGEPDFAYERFTAPPRFDGVAVPAGYPGAPDSTVARFSLPRPLAPGDTLHVVFEWEARPSTLPRRQGRRGRSYDFAQWYPKVAVYDRTGWAVNALKPAGEFYGEFGTYDVNLALPDDQVIGATGIPVEGDPGWERVRRWGEVHLARDAYADVGDPRPVDVPPGHRRVRFHARDVHHFGWSVSPDYRYEGASYRRSQPPDAGLPFTVFTTVPIHVLYRPGDEPQWGDGQAVERTARALAWLESIFGAYAYPQITNLHRIEGGGTEFPMLMMNGSASQGLILHELGHIYTYGILANNEWRDGWLDEGFTSYQTAMATSSTPQDVPDDDGAAAAPPRPGYRGRAALPEGDEFGRLGLYWLDRIGRAEPIGTTAHEFSEFSIYNQMIYSRAEMMFGQLRDVLGDRAFRQFLRDYYRSWALRHVDERAVREAAEGAHGAPLGWFFDQWVHHTGLIDYALEDVAVDRTADGWVTRARLAKRGAYFHPMPVGVRTEGGWTIVRATATDPSPTVEIRTAAEPLAVRLDPDHTTEESDRRDDLWVRRGDHLARAIPHRVVVDWPFLQQLAYDRTVSAVRPLAWYSEPGRLTPALLIRQNYQGEYDLAEIGIAHAVRTGAKEGLQLWAQLEHPTFRRGPLMGLAFGGWRLDGILGGFLQRSFDRSPFLYAAGRRDTITIGVRALAVGNETWRPEQWDDGSTAEVYAAQSLRWPNGVSLRWDAIGGWADKQAGDDDGFFGRVELEAQRIWFAAGGRAATRLRVYGGASSSAPRQRAVYASSRDPVETILTHWWRPRSAVLKQENVNYLPLGGAALRGYSPTLTAARIASVSLEPGVRLIHRQQRGRYDLALWLSAFGDAGRANGSDTFTSDLLADAGIGLAVRGRLFDRDVRLRVDLPLWVSSPELALDEPGEDAGALRWSFSFSDLW